MTSTVRPAVVGDGDDVARVYAEASFAALGAAANRAAVEAAAAGGHPLWRPLRRPEAGQWMLVSDTPGGFGFASFGRTVGDAGHLYALYVAPPAWGTGIGTRLHHAAVETFRSAGVAVADLWVQVENSRARRFYEGRGWCLAGEERRNERGTFVRMEKHL